MSEGAPAPVQKGGLVKLTHVSLDGTKVRGNASSTRR